LKWYVIKIIIQFKLLIQNTVIFLLLYKKLKQLRP
jgi:hypothetical protein